MQSTLNERAERAEGESWWALGSAGVATAALSCLESWQAELLRGRCHGQLHLTCGSSLAPCGWSFPLIFGGIDL